MAVNKPRRPRGVRLSDLDRSKVYRVGYVGRRWEVLGEDPAGATGGGRMAADAGRPKAEASAGVGRHLAPDGARAESP